MKPQGRRPAGGGNGGGILYILNNGITSGILAILSILRDPLRGDAAVQGTQIHSLLMYAPNSVAFQVIEQSLRSPVRNKFAGIEKKNSQHGLARTGIFGPVNLFAV